MDAKGCLDSVRFAAVDLSRLPQFSPEDPRASNCNDLSKVEAKLDKLHSDLHSQLDNLRAVVVDSLESCHRQSVELNRNDDAAVKSRHP